jgi:hypothetical protein
MRINELLTESQLEQLEEGPILNKIGSAVGKGVGTVAKGVGAVAGGVAGVGSAVKKGFTAGKQTVAGAGDDPVAAPSGTPAPKQGIMGKIGSAIGNFKAGYNQTTGAPTAAPSGAAPSAQSINQQGPAGTAPAVAQTGAAGAALAKTTAAVANQTTAKAGQTVYAQVKANIDKLDKKGKQRILQLLQKSIAVPDPKPAAGVAPAATTPPAADPAATAPANTMANVPVSATNTAAADNPNQPPAVKKRGGKVAGQDSQTPDAIRKRNARRDKKNAAATTGGAGAFNQMAQQATQQNASKINYGNALSEALAQRVEIHKQKMFETGLSNGTTSVFRK